MARVGVSQEEEHCREDGSGRQKEWRNDLETIIFRRGSKKKKEKKDH